MVLFDLSHWTDGWMLVLYPTNTVICPTSSLGRPRSLATFTTTRLHLLRNATVAGEADSSPPPHSSSSSSGTRWTESSRWEQQEVGGDHKQQFLLQEKYGTYFRVPNPATLMTKVICTMGPACRNPTILGCMMDAGMSTARINMSHASDYNVMRETIEVVRRVAQTRRRLCPIILDTKGPEIRVLGVSSPDNKLSLTSGDHVVLSTGKYSNPTTLKQHKNAPLSDDKQVAITYPYLSNAIQQGDVVLLDDGRISLIVTSVPNDDTVHGQVIEGGTLLVNKGVNLPGCQVDLPHLTEKDKADILFGVSQKIEYIAHSFTRSSTGINQVQELPGVVESGCHLIAKIESQEGMDNFASILRVSDGVMVARGDLGVEIPLERVCSVQK